MDDLRTFIVISLAKTRTIIIMTDLKRMKSTRKALKLPVASTKILTVSFAMTKDYFESLAVFTYRDTYFNFLNQIENVKMEYNVKMHMCTTTVETGPLLVY